MLPSIQAVLVAGFVSFISNWQFGYQITYVNTASEDFFDLYKHAVDLNETVTVVEDWAQKWSLVVSSFYPGTCVGFVMVPLLVKKIGIKNGMFYSSFPAVFGCFLMIFVQSFVLISPTCFLVVLMFGRFLTGIQSGCSLCLLPLFFRETSDKEHREFLVALQQVFQAVATFIGFLCGSNLILSAGYTKVVWLQIIGLVPSLLGLIFFFLAPKTPKDIINANPLKKEYDRQTSIISRDLSKSARFYQGSDAELCILGLQSEISTERTKLGNRQGAGQKDIKGGLLGLIAGISFGFTGDDLVDSYSTEVLYSHSHGPVDALIDITLLLGLVLIGASVIGAFLLDQYGNRIMLIYGLIGTALANVLSSTGSFLGSWKLTATGMLLTKTFIGLGAGAPAWFLSTELVSPQNASLAQTFSTGSLLVVVGLLTSVFLSVDQLIPCWSLALLTSVPALICALILYLFLPETKGTDPYQVNPLLNEAFFSGLKAPFVRSYGSISTDRLSQ